MEYSLFMHVWAWIGLGAAIVLLILLFGSDVLRVEKNVSRWRDPYWLSWTFVVAYLFHNVEEYALDMYGTALAFPAGIAAILGRTPSEMFFEVVNISMVWLAAPLAAYVARKYKWKYLSMAFAGVMLVNSLTHIGAGINGDYNAGLLTTILFLVPLPVWSLCVCFGKGRMMPAKALWANLGMGLLYHIIMFGTTLGLMLPARVSDFWCSMILLADAVLIFYLWIVYQKHWDKKALDE